MTNIELKVMSLMGTFSTTEEKIAKYFLENPQNVFHIPIADLARNCGVSQVMWVRFCKTIGFNGLKDFKKTLFSELNSDTTPPVPTSNFNDITDHSEIPDIASAIMLSSVQSIENTIQLMNYDHIYEAVNSIINASSIRLFGVGASGQVAYDFSQKLQRIGKFTFFDKDFHAQMTYAANTSKNDVAIFISHSGATKEIIETINLVKKSDCKTISLTKYGANPLVDLADINLFTSSPEIYYRSGAMSSRIAQLIIIDILFTAIASKDYDNIKNALEKSHSACRPHKV